MALLPIVTGIDNKVLRTQSLPVKKIDKKIKKLVKDMTETVISVDGLGIAAPQVGLNLRIYIARLNYNTASEMWVPMINAEFAELSKEIDEHEEGCLSIPGKFGQLSRSKKVTIRYMDLGARHHLLELDQLNARIMQHEMDHLNAILIADKWKLSRHMNSRR